MSAKSITSWMAGRPRRSLLALALGTAAVTAGCSTPPTEPRWINATNQNSPPAPCAQCGQTAPVTAAKPAPAAQSAPIMGTPFDVAAMWQPELGLAEDTEHGQRLTAGMVGRVILADKDGRLICANGKLTIRLYNNGTPLPGEDGSKPIEMWVMEPTILQKFAKKDTAGWGYNLWLPTARLTQNITRVRMAVEFEDEAGHKLLAKQASVRLKYDDKTARLLDRQAPEYAQWQQSSPQGPPPGQQNQVGPLMGNMQPNGGYASQQQAAQYQPPQMQMPYQPTFQQQPAQMAAQYQPPNQPQPPQYQPVMQMPQVPVQYQQPVQQMPQMPVQYQQPPAQQQSQMQQFQLPGQMPPYPQLYLGGQQMPVQYQNAQPLPQVMAPPANAVPAPTLIGQLPAQFGPGANQTGPQLNPTAQLPPRVLPASYQANEPQASASGVGSSPAANQPNPFPVFPGGMTSFQLQAGSER